MPKDFYEILGVKKTAGDDEIKKAYRKIAQKHHPDRNKGDKKSEDTFKEANMAYETLSDKKKRQAYDQFGQAYGQGGMPGGGYDFSQFQGFGGGFADIFESFFSSSGGGSGRRKKGMEDGEHIESELTISFEEGAFGCEKEFTYTKTDTCETCSGNGAKPKTKILPCSVCQGTGEIKQIQNTILGQIMTKRVCSKCAGEGKIAEHPCESCSGTGRKRVKSDIKVKIPPGVDTGQIIRIAGKGNAGYRGGRHGDFYIHIIVLPSKRFIRKGYDTLNEAKIHILEAILGAEISVDTLHGNVKLKIPAGTEPLKTFKLTGYGIPRATADSRGDHFVKIHVEMPKKLSKSEREHYEALAKEAGFSGTDGEKSFFKKFL